MTSTRCLHLEIFFLSFFLELDTGPRTRERDAFLFQSKLTRCLIRAMVEPTL